MAEIHENSNARRMIIHYRTRGAQVWIYLGKMLRMFVYQSDWKVLPMAALIAGLVGMVIRSRLFITMEGTLMGAFALVMVCIWNGCFNSIQVICRERDVIKREHRSGMHISSYIVSHMIYQALLCLAQTVVTLYVTQQVGVKYPAEGLFTSWLIVDFGISMFLITYASDMMSLWVSCLSRTTTTAMTIMPFVLIFQLVFSGGMMSLPAWTKSITPFTISNPALKVLASQSAYNDRPVMTIWNQANKMKGEEIIATITQQQVFDLLQNENSPSVAELRSTQVSRVLSSEEIGNAQDALGIYEMFMQNGAIHLDKETTLGELIDLLADQPDVQAHMGDSYTVKTTLGEIIDLIGEDKVADILQNRVAKASRVADYDNTKENIIGYWFVLILFVFAFAGLSTITLEFIDKDKR